MTGLLVSVRDPGEAVDAIAAGVDLLDVKEPLQGALGCASAVTLREISATASKLAPHLPLSAAIGELSDWKKPQNVSPIDLTHDLAGYRFLKLGLAHCAHRRWQADWLEIAGLIAATSTLVPVIYADAERANAPAARNVLEWAVKQSSPMVLVDTWDKSDGNLFTAMCSTELSEVVEVAHRHHIEVVLAGKLDASMIDRLASLGADYWGVRSAVASDDRVSKLSTRKMAAWREFAVATNSRLRESASPR